MCSPMPQDDSCRCLRNARRMGSRWWSLPTSQLKMPSPVVAAGDRRDHCTELVRLFLSSCLKANTGKRWQCKHLSSKPPVRPGRAHKTLYIKFASKGCRKLPDVPARWQVRLAWLLSQGNTNSGARVRPASASLARNPTTTQKCGSAGRLVRCLCGHLWQPEQHLLSCSWDKG